jgi:hypothetical protein
MTELRLLFRYALMLLLVAGPVEFGLGRALSRIGGMLQPGPVADVVNGVATFGLRLLEPVHLLALVVLALAALLPIADLRARSADLEAGDPTHPQSAILPLRGAAPPQSAGPKSKIQNAKWPSLLIGAFLLLSLTLTVVPAPVPLALILAINGVAAVLVVGGAAWFAFTARTHAALRLAVGLLGLAFAGYFVFVVLDEGSKLETVGQALTAGTLGDLGVWAHALGEGSAVAWALVVGWALGPFAPGRAGRVPLRLGRLLIALVPGVLLAVAPLFETWMQGVLARMSIGFTLFLPPPVYAVAAVAYVYALLTCWDPRAPAQLGIPWLREIGAALILLPVAGFDLLSNYQLTMAILVMLLLTGLVRPLSQPVPAPAAAPQPVRR